MIQKQTVKNIIDAFRKSCLKRYPDDIDPIPIEEREKRLGQKADNPLLAAMFDGVFMEPIDALAEVLANPRILKQVLRRVDNAWDTLHGEIDFDDLLVSHALQYARKEVYAFILNHLTAIRNLESGDRDVHERDRRAPLKQMWETEVGTANAESNDTLLAFLFPWWKSDGHGSLHYIPQGVRHSTPTDYWLRFQSEGLHPSHLRDQLVLHATQAWVRDHGAEIHDGLTLSQFLYTSAEAGDKLEHFSGALAGDEIRSLASELFAIIRDQNGNKSHRDICGAFINLWRLSLRRRWDGHEAWATAEVCKALPVSLRFANDIYYFWRHQERRGDDEVPTPNVRNAVVAEARRLWEANLQTLTRSLDPAFHYSLFHFAVHYSASEMGGPRFVAREWRWFGDLVLRAANTDPDMVLPQMTPFLVYQPDSFESRMGLRVESGQELFGPGFRDMMRLLAERLKPTQLEPREVSQVEFLRRAAAEWLATEKQPPPQNSPATDSTDQPGSE